MHAPLAIIAARDLGNCLAGLGTPTFGAPWLYLTYGVVGGVGAGMAYITPLALVSKWFPERRGLAGGLVTASFALGAFVYNQWIPRLPGFHAVAVHAGHLVATRSVDISYPPSKVLAMPQFYLLWLQLFANAIAGLSIIANAVPLIADLTDLAPASIAPLFGTVSIFNAVGRFLWGGISDRIGCNKTFVAMFVVQATTLLLLGHARDLTGALTGISVVLLCCGGGFGTMPSYNAQYFGTKYLGLNYGLVLSAWGFAGLIGPTLMARVRDSSGSYVVILPAIAFALAVAVILPLITRQPTIAGSGALENNVNPGRPT